MTEESFIEALCARVPHGPLPFGPGDDAALLRSAPGDRSRVVTTDAYVEGVHFLRSHPPAWLAEKLLAANLADVGAMGAVAEAYTLAACLPGETPDRWWAAFCDGLGVASRRAGVEVVGGDITASPGGVVLSMTAWGSLDPGTLLTRQGGRPGDLLMVMGSPGLSRAGWEQWEGMANQDWGLEPPDGLNPGLLAHLRPRPDLDAGPWALAHGAHAAMDLSDGLARDGARLAKASGVDLVVSVDALPPLPASVELDLAGRLAGGEEHELLSLAPPSCRASFEARGFAVIGEAVEASHAPTIRWTQGGKLLALSPRTYEHF